MSSARRFIYNWFLNYCNTNYIENGIKYPGYNHLTKILTDMRHSKEFEWLNQYNLSVLRGGLKDLDTAFKKFFTIPRIRAPKFKKKRTDKVRFSSRGDRFGFKGKNKQYAYIPGLSECRSDLIYCANHRAPTDKDILYRNVRVSFDGINYWITFSVETERIIDLPNDHDHLYDENEPLGIDVGIRDSAVCSDGTVYNGIYHSHRLNVLRHRCNTMMAAVIRDVNRRQSIATCTKAKYEDIPESKNQLKRLKRLQRTYIQISNAYRTHYHTISKSIANKCPPWIVLEDLDFDKLYNLNAYINNSIHEARLSMLIDFIDYKCRDKGITVLYADKGYKSSQICSNCGSEHKCGYSKTYKCPVCGFTIDRDLNAAINLKSVGYNYFL